MATIGIGDFTHAKPQVSPAKTGLKLNARTHEIPVKAPEGNAKKTSPTNAKETEGQLSVDILQREDQMLIIAPVAGVDKGDIHVSIQDDVLTIRGERKIPEGINMGEALVRELFWGTFSRSIVLPDHIDRKGIAARCHQHVLMVTIPKTEDFKSRIIHVEAEDDEQ